MTEELKTHLIKESFSQEWLEKQAQSDDILLAHALDGVIWGKIVGDKLVTSAPLNTATLQEIRLFNDRREVHIWRNGDTWYQYKKDETGIEADDYIDESYILWGVTGSLRDDGFTTLEDGAQGLHHTVPIDASAVNNRHLRACLLVRHYFGEDDMGVNFIAYSRLMGLSVKDFSNGEK